MTRLRTAVLASGGGSNLQALIDHLAHLGERRALDVVVVASDRADAGALARARAAGIATALIDPSREPGALPLDNVLRAQQVDLVVLAGFLRLVPAAVTARYAGRMINVHPGPLPEFGGKGMYGLRVHRAVLAAHARFSGPTVHLVDDVYDHGQVLAHWPVPVGSIDDAQLLASRVLRAEHLLYPRMIQRLAARVIDGRAVRAPVLPPFDAELDDAVLGGMLDNLLNGVIKER